MATGSDHAADRGRSGTWLGRAKPAGPRMDD
jgi:hypothetical protein